MLYYRCPTCKTLLANKIIPYEEELNKICASNNTNPKAKEDLLTKYHFINPCCRMRVMGYVKLIDIII